MRNRRDVALRDEDNAMKLRTKRIALALGVALTWALAGAPPTTAALPEPDHIVYGMPLRNGEPLAEGVVTVRLAGGGEALASYRIGSDPLLGGRYALRIPIDAVDPRLPGTARPGDEVEVFVDGVPAGNTTVGERGAVQLLDLDEIGGGLPSIAVQDVAAYEGNAGNTIFQFVVALSAPDDEDVTFTWGTAPGTAQGGIDFTEVPPGTEATIGAGNTSTTLQVIVKGDTFEEPDETFFVNLANPSANALILDGQAVGTILDDDRPPAISIADLGVIEGDAGPVAGTLTLTITRPIASPITVSWQTADGTATVAGGDYLAGSGIATFAPGSTQTTIEVTVLGDTDDESDETFTVSLSGASANALIADGAATVTILDDDGFLTWVEAESLAALPESLFGASGVAVSPDGLHVYATGRADDGLAFFARDVATGHLTYLDSLYDGDVTPSGTVDGLDGAEAVAVSPDGAHVYVAGYADGAIAHLVRDPATGMLTWKAVHRDASLGGSADGLLGASHLAFSPDGSHLYVAGFVDDAVAVFARDTNPASPTFGNLAYLAAVFDGGGPVDGLDGAQWVEVSPDGKNLYVASGVDKAVAAFTRDPATGLLTFLQVAKDGLGGVNGLDGASSLAVSGDGRHLYATGQAEDAIAIFARNDMTGLLTWIGMVVDGTAGAEGLDGATGVRVSGDLRFVYVLGYFEDALAVYTRDETTGLLAFLEVHRDGFGAIDGLARGNELAVSADDQHLYVAGQNDDAIAVFMRDAFAPSLPNVLESTSHQVGVFSNDPTVDMLWSGSVDNPGGSGMDGYSFLFDSTPLTNADRIVDLPHTVDPHTITSPPLPEGTTYHFHFRACDLVGNCTVTVHLGPYLIDLTAPANPTSVMSTSHPLGVATADATITMVWSAASDALSGVDGFAYAFDRDPAPLCDQAKDLEETASTVDSPALADGPWYFHLCTRDNAGNWSAPVVRGPYVVETEPPVVAAVDTVAGTGDHALVAGEATDAAITQLLVSFSEAMADPAGNAGANDVTNPANYRVVEAGPDGLLETATCAALLGDDVLYAVDAADWYPGALTVVLGVHGGVSLPAGRYRLLACGAAGLTDAQGQPLDGDYDGTGGDDFALPFTVSFTNLLLNPNFDLDLASWVRLPAVGGAVRHDTADADDAWTSGSTLAEAQSGQVFYGVSQCVPVASERYRFGGRARLASADPIDPMAFAQVQFYSSTNCSTGAIGSELFSTTVEGDTAGDWLPFEGSELAPGSARSAFVSFLFDIGGVADFDAYLDDTYFQSVGAIIFSSGFETGGLGEWSE